jgi:hypothetical protein
MVIIGETKLRSNNISCYLSVIALVQDVLCSLMMTKKERAVIIASPILLVIMLLVLSILSCMTNQPKNLHFGSVVACQMEVARKWMIEPLN